MNNPRSIVKFCFHALFFASPILFVLGAYVVLDPFRVVRYHDDISAGSFLPLNKDFASTSIYLRHAPEHKFNSFLMGSSRTMAYRLDEWKTHLPSDAVPYAFDASKETLWGVEKKLAYLDSTGADIRAVLFIIDPLHTFAEMRNNAGHLFIKDPRVSGESVFRFQKTFLEAWLADLFFAKFIDYWLFHTIRPYMKGVLAIDENNLVDPITAERNMAIEANIDKDPHTFYEQRRDVFYTRDTTAQRTYPSLIGTDHVIAMIHIRHILQKHETDMEIVISPGYDQIAIDPADLRELQDLFGAAHVHDYSGINAITNETHNYIESSHYRSHVGKQIMDEVYGPVP